ncbi:MAG: hypothetical protein GDA39_05995 [Hyphomonadaceae bacterium]|nr:hypothetical protein [Hyphomonadaceae bacterium]
MKPKHYHPNADIMPEKELSKPMPDIRRTWRACLRAMPSHQAFIDRNCRAPL